MGALIQSLDKASIPFIVWLQGFRSPATTALMQFFSQLGTEHFFILLLPFLYWIVSKKWGAMVALSLVFSSYLVGVIKWGFNLPRPPTPPVAILWVESSPSFISGHAATASAVWGVLALMARRLWFWLLATLLIFAIGFSRLYLGVHYPADVIGGWLVGFMVAWAVAAFFPWVEMKMKTEPAWRLLLAALILSAIMVLAHPRWKNENLWPAPDAFQLGGLLFGLFSGMVWDVKSLHFYAGGSFIQRLLRLLLGMTIVSFFYIAPKILADGLAIDSYAVAQILRFLRYALVGFTVVGLAPWVFIRLHLVE